MSSSTIPLFYYIRMEWKSSAVGSREGTVERVQENVNCREMFVFLWLLGSWVFFFFVGGGGGGGNLGSLCVPAPLGAMVHWLGGSNARGGWGKKLQKSFMRDDFSSRSKPLPFYLPFFIRKDNLFIFLPLEMAPLSQTFSKHSLFFFSLSPYPFLYTSSWNPCSFINLRPVHEKGSPFGIIGTLWVVPSLPGSNVTVERVYHYYSSDSN